MRPPMPRPNPGSCRSRCRDPCGYYLPTTTREAAMNKRFMLSVVALFVASMITGMVVHGMILGGDYANLKALFRAPEQQQAMFGWMIAAHVLIAIGFTWIYRAGRDARPWMGQGFRFGLAVAVMSVIPGYLIYYAVQPMPGEMVVKQVIFDTLAMVVLSLVAAAVNRDARTDAASR